MNSKTSLNLLTPPYRPCSPSGSKLNSCFPSTLSPPFCPSFGQEPFFFRVSAYSPALPPLPCDLSFLPSGRLALGLTFHSSLSFKMRRGISSLPPRRQERELEALCRVLDSTLRPGNLSSFETFSFFFIPENFLRSAFSSEVYNRESLCLLPQFYNLSHPAMKTPVCPEKGSTLLEYAPKPTPAPSKRSFFFSGPSSSILMSLEPDAGSSRSDLRARPPPLSRRFTLFPARRASLSPRTRCHPFWRKHRTIVVRHLPKVPFIPCASTSPLTRRLSGILPNLPLSATGPVC